MVDGLSDLLKRWSKRKERRVANGGRGEISLFVLLSGRAILHQCHSDSIFDELQEMERESRNRGFLDVRSAISSAAMRTG